MGTDFLFRCGTRTAARAFHSIGVKTYLYDFNYHFKGYKDPSNLLCELNSQVGCGVYHGSELTYVFGKSNETEAEAQMSSIMGQYWTNFAKTGSPNLPSLNDDDLENWKEYRLSHDNHMELTATPKNSDSLFKENCDFWDRQPRQGKYPSDFSSKDSVVLV